MVKIATKIAKISVLASMLTSVAFADVAAPIGFLNSGENVTISTSAGSFPVVGDYAYMPGDVINTRAGAVAALSIDTGGHVYVSPNSSAIVDQVNGQIVAKLDKGSVGFSFTAGTDFSIQVNGNIISAHDSAEQKLSGAVALGADGKLVVRSYGATLVITDEHGVTTPVESGQSIALHQGQATLVTTAVEDEDDDDGIMWLLGGLALVALISSDSSSSDVASSDSADTTGGASDASGSGGSGSSLPAGVTFIDANGVAHTGLDGRSASNGKKGGKKGGKNPSSS